MHLPKTSPLELTHFCDNPIHHTLAELCYKPQDTEAAHFLQTSPSLKEGFVRSPCDEPSRTGGWTELVWVTCNGHEAVLCPPSHHVQMASPWALYSQHAWGLL